jgi:hypothetical protein
MDALVSELELRRVRANDLPWLLSLAYRRYRSFDPGKTLAWLFEVMNSPKGLVIRSDDACVIAVITVSPWHTPEERECHIVFCFAEQNKHWQACRLLRQSQQWARSQDCRLWRFHSDTLHDVSPLAEYIGAKICTPRYMVEFDDGE